MRPKVFKYLGWQEYPKCLYHEFLQPPTTVQSKDEEKKFGRQGWVTRPNAFNDTIYSRYFHIKGHLGAFWQREWKHTLPILIALMSLIVSIIALFKKP